MISGPARAWKCRGCHRLTVRLPREPDPPHCDFCTGDLEPFKVRRSRPYRNPMERP